MKIVNINSSIQFPEEAIKMCYSRDDFSQIIATRCPVLLVDSSLMDIVYYLWELRSYNNRCLWKKLDSTIDEITNTVNGKDFELNSGRYHHRWNNSFESVFENIYDAFLTRGPN